MADPVPNRKDHEAHISTNGGYSADIKVLDNLTIEICTECHFITATCNHKHTTWIEGGLTLICDFCEIDGT